MMLLLMLMIMMIVQVREVVSCGWEVLYAMETLKEKQTANTVLLSSRNAMLNFIFFV